jgi:hypothetical protein
VRARRAEATARSDQARAEKVATFLSDMLGDMDPIGMGKTVHTEILDPAGGRRQRRGAPGPADPRAAARRRRAAGNLTRIELIPTPHPRR